MSAKIVLCEGCGTRLEVEAGVRFVACAHCGHQTRVPGVEPAARTAPAPTRPAPARRGSRLVKIAWWTGGLLMTCVLVYVSSAWIRGHARGLWWQWFGDEPFICDGNEVVTITGKTFEHPDGAVGAAGACEITLIDCHLEAAQPIGLIGGPSLVMEGGSLTATETAIRTLGGPKKLVLRDVTITSQGDGVVLYGRDLEVEIHGGSIQAAKVALASTYRTRTRVRGTSIQGGELALKAVQGGELWLDETVTVRGKSACAEGSAIEGPGAPTGIEPY